MADKIYAVSPCPYCGGDNVYTYGNDRRWRCPNCNDDDPLWHSLEFHFSRAYKTDPLGIFMSIMRDKTYYHYSAFVKQWRKYRIQPSFFSVSHIYLKR